MALIIARYLHGAIGRQAIEDNMFHIGMSLTEHTLYRARQLVGCLICASNNGYLDHVKRAIRQIL